MKIFVLVSRIPYPLEKGDKLRAYHQVKELAQRHEVFLCCLSDEAPDETALSHLRSICQRVEVVQLSRKRIAMRMVAALFSSRPFQVHYFFQRAAARMVEKHINDFKPDHIYCQLIRCSEYVKHLFHIPKTLDYMDAFNKGMERLAEKSKGWKKLVWRIESRRLVRYENVIYDYFDLHTIISVQDRDLIYHPKRKAIAVIPNGVDTAFFARQHPPSNDKVVVFTGNMSYPPNMDTAERLANAIMPRVHQRHPDAQLLLAGASPHPRVSALNHPPKVVVTGWMDDIREGYLKGMVFAAPLRIGTGLQNKLLEAMSMELPCVTSSLANNALGARPNHELLVCDSDEAFADAICTLLENSKLREKFSTHGRSFVEANYSWSKACEKLSDLMVGAHQPRS